ncbi:MAG: GHMP kinase [Microbacterium sp.]|uniref:GHMP family kinase ATP-binding protein n=1 Tax=Microbacterium sp. TaxID=51671 RepID=UPI001AC6C39A|nr:GHMP kinase [Microbacterium sp.]MBN9177778.1 GHMP kinase [Microbacterium sp.]
MLNATIGRYAYATVTPLKKGSIEFHSPDREMTNAVDTSDLDVLSSDYRLHVAVLKRMGTQFGGGEIPSIRLSTQVDAPPGSGLGSSSTLVVAMTVALAEYFGVSLGAYETARLAWEIERTEAGLEGGWQDQYAATFGGVNYIESRQDGRMIVNPLRVRPEVLAELEASLLLYFGGVSRSSAAVISEQRSRVESGDVNAIEATHAIRREAETMKDHLVRGDIEGIATSLREGWEQKKKIASRVGTPEIARAYEVAEAHGMRAGKVSGAGGGGFMMLIVDPERRLEVARALQEECGGSVSEAHFVQTGAAAWRTQR